MTAPDWLEEIKRLKAEAEKWWSPRLWMADEGRIMEVGEDLCCTTPQVAAYIVALANRADELIAAMERESLECVWREDADGIWYATCGALHVFTDGSPSQNSHQFCPYCGGRLVEKRYVEEEVGDE